MTANLDPEQLLTKAKVVASQYDEAKESLARLSDERITCINDLRDNGLSWAEIGRVFSISPQAAMYVSGHATRTPAKSGAAAKKKSKKKS